MPKIKKEPELDFEEEKILKYEKDKEQYKKDKQKEDEERIKKEREINLYKKEVPQHLKKFKIEYKKCYACYHELLFPKYFTDYLEYYKKNIPNKWNKYIRCNCCLDNYLNKQYTQRQNKMVSCNGCGLEYFNPYKTNGTKWKHFNQTKHEYSHQHQLYEYDTDTFCDILDYLKTNRHSSKNIYTMSRDDLIKWIKENNIKYKIVEYKSHRDILREIIELFKNNNKSFPIKNNNEYDFWNDLSRDELCVLIKECGLKIKYYKNLTKDELIKKIIDY